MSPCFFKSHEIGELLNLNIHPDVDLLSFESPEKSASVKLVRRCGCSSVPWGLESLCKVLDVLQLSVLHVIFALAPINRHW